MLRSLTCLFYLYPSAPFFCASSFNCVCVCTFCFWGLESMVWRAVANVHENTCGGERSWITFKMFTGNKYLWKFVIINFCCQNVKTNNPVNSDLNTFQGQKCRISSLPHPGLAHAHTKTWIRRGLGSRKGERGCREYTHRSPYPCSTCGYPIPTAGYYKWVLTTACRPIMT